MYNEHNKMTYLNILNKNTTTYSNVKNIFEAIEYAEKNLDTDICNINPTQYIDILAKSSDKKISFSEFYNKLSLLLRYRIFCQARGLIEPEKFYSHNDPFEYLSNRREVHSMYTEIYSDKFNIDTPLQLNKLLNKIYNDELHNINKAFDVNFIYEELSIIQLQMQYHGIEQQQMALIKNKDISVDKNKIMIFSRGTQIILIDPSLSRLVEKRLESEFIIKRGSLLQLNAEFFFGIGNDNSEEKVSKRMMALYHKYMRKRQNIDSSLPTNKEIQLSGTIYRMCLETKACKLIDEFEVADLYYKVSGKKIVNNLLRREIFSEYIKRYDYLDNNNWPE